MKTNKLKLLTAVALCSLIFGCKKSQVASTPTNDSAQVTLPGVKLHIFTTSDNKYYVSHAGNDATGDGTSAHPFATINKAVSEVTAGGFVYIKNDGEYTYPTGASSANGSVVDIVTTSTVNHSGSSGAPITYTNWPGFGSPVIHAKFTDNPTYNGLYRAILVSASYINLDNLTVIGDNATMTPPADAATAALTKYNTGGIVIGGQDVSGTHTPIHIPDHVNVTNCTIHDMPSAGIQAIQSDYIKIESNTVYRCGFYSNLGPSGISDLVPYNSNTGSNDGSESDPHIQILKNVCHDNKSTVVNAAAGELTDGSGIIVDVNNTDRDGNIANKYKGWTRVENNICYNNGGGGVTITRAHYVTVINNTCYHNVQSTELFGSYAEIGFYGSDCYSANVNSNIIVSRNSGLCNRASVDAATAATNYLVFKYNNFYNGSSTVGTSIPIPDSNQSYGDPLFTGGSVSTFAPVGTTVTPSQFIVAHSYSPAVNKGYPTLPHYATQDFAGVTRYLGTAPDCGAYETY